LASKAKQFQVEVHKVILSSFVMGKYMIKYIVLTSLALLTLTFAVLEGLIESLPPLFIQATGLLTIVCAAVFIIWTLKIQAQGFKKDR